MRLEFFVPGEPVTQGSKRTFVNKKTGKPVVNPKTGMPIIVDDNSKKLHNWRSTVGWYAKQAFGRECLLPDPIRFVVTFWRERRKGDFRTRDGQISKLLRDTAEAFPRPKPDTFKLCRAVEDALTGVIWLDDSQICDHHIFKRYCRGIEQPGVHVVIETMDNSIQGKEYTNDDAMRAEPTLFGPAR